VRPGIALWRVELIDLESDARLVAQSKNLNLTGCFVETVTPFAKGSKVRRESHAAARRPSLPCARRLIRSRREWGSGFIRIEPGGEATLDKWVGSLKE